VAVDKDKWRAVVDMVPRTCGQFIVWLNVCKPLQGKGKGNIHPKKGHEGPAGE
jgi:hypothetical protein